MFQNNLLMAAASTASAAGYTVDYSCRFDGANKGYLIFTPTTSSAAQKTYNLSAWVKKGNLNLRQVVIGASNSSASAYSYALMASNDTYNQFGSSASSGAYHMYDDNLKMRDPSAWMHLMVAIDTTQSVEADRAKIYYNGVEITTFTNVGYPSLNLELIVNNASYDIAVGTLGAWGPETAFDGYIAQPAMVTELALTATDFGEFDSNGVWRPIDITGLDYSGENSFLLDFADSSNLGNDVSGNDNDFTNSGLVATDQMTDTPTNNKCTWSSISHGPTTSAPVLSNGNLDITYPPADCGLAGTMGVIGSGKYYWEYEMTSGTGGTPAQLLGMVSQPYAWAAGRLSLSAGFRSYYTTGVKNTGGTESSYGDSWAVGDRMGVAVDLDNEAMYFAKNNTWQDSGDPTSGASKTGAAFTDITASDVWVPFMHTGGNRYSTVIFNEDDFEYTPPTGYVALATSNLPAPAIKDGTANFQPTLYTGDGSTRNIDQTGNSTFQPDMVWIKNRSQADPHMLIDAARGVTKELNPNDIAVESTDANGLTSFDSDGFGLGTGAGGYNDDTENFVAWQWKAGGGAGSSNEDGTINTITTTVNTTAGISIGTYTGTGVAATIGHGLGVVPKFIIVRDTSVEQTWDVYHVGNTDAPETEYVHTDRNNATADGLPWNDTLPTTTVFSIGSSTVFRDTSVMVYYAFADIEGFSKFSNYTGNGNADGPTVYTGFKPAYVTIKKTTGTGNWVIYDNQRSPHNEIDDQLLINTTAAETTGSEEIDFLSNGFKIRTADSDVNTSAGNYIYAAFAEYPFGGDGATPATAF